MSAFRTITTSTCATRLGAGVIKTGRLRAVSGVAVCQWARVGQAPGDRQGLQFEALDNGFGQRGRRRAGRYLRSSSEREIERFFARWEARLPSPFTVEDRLRGYRYALSIRQLEVSDTRVFDPPAAGRAWFEQPLVDQLTLGRPDHVSVVFARRRQPPHARALSHPDHPRRRRADDPGALPPLQGQAVLQGTAARCGPRRRSTTPTTSASAAY